MSTSQKLPFEVGKIYTNYWKKDELWANLPEELSTMGEYYDLEQDSIFLVLGFKKINIETYHLKAIMLDKTQKVGWFVNVKTRNFDDFFREVIV